MLSAHIFLSLSFLPQIERTLQLQVHRAGEWWCLRQSSDRSLSSILGCVPSAPVTPPTSKKTPQTNASLFRYSPVIHISRVFIFSLELCLPSWCLTEIYISYLKLDSEFLQDTYNGRYHLPSTFLST